MTGEELRKFLVGKTILEAEARIYMDLLVLETLVFTDGSSVELAGQADEAYVWEVRDSGGTLVPLERRHDAD